MCRVVIGQPSEVLFYPQLLRFNFLATIYF